MRQYLVYKPTPLYINNFQRTVSKIRTIINRQFFVGLFPEIQILLALMLNIPGARSIPNWIIDPEITGHEVRRRALRVVFLVILFNIHAPVHLMPELTASVVHDVHLMAQIIPMRQIPSSRERVHPAHVVSLVQVSRHVVHAPGIPHIGHVAHLSLIVSEVRLSIAICVVDVVLS